MRLTQSRLQHVAVTFLIRSGFIFSIFLAMVRRAALTRDAGARCAGDRQSNRATSIETGLSRSRPKALARAGSLGFDDVECF
jgi:hypothetical protein